MKELERRVPGVQILWRAFELRPEPVPTLPPAGEYLQRVWSQSVYPMAERLGIEMKLPTIQPRSRSAHEAARWARKQGRFDRMNEAIFRAFFERGEDISNRDVLAALASSEGMNGEELKHALERNDHLTEVMADERMAVTYGLTGVPAFVAGGAVLFGVQTADALEDLVNRASQVTDEETAGPLPHLPIKLSK